MTLGMLGGGVLVGLVFCGCTRDRHPSGGGRASLSTDTDSAALPDKQQRLEFLGRYLRLKSVVSDAEFVIRYRDNSQGLVPGPSDWDIRAALVVGASAAAWRAGWEECAGANSSDAAGREIDAWARSLLDRRPDWRSVASAPRCFRNPRHAGSVVLIYEQEGLVLLCSKSS
jgi:hypothetical protein